MNPLMILKGAVARMGIQPSPISLAYEVTYLCNLDCIYCDRHTALSNEMKNEEIFSALTQFYDLGMRTISLDGGEPLLHSGIDKIVQWLTERGVKVAVNSNGKLIPKKIDIIRKLSLVKISLDGLQKNHEIMRGTGSFEKAITGAIAARDAGVEVKFTCTVGRHNAGSLDSLVDLAEDLRIPIVFQPAKNSLFMNSDRDGSSFQLDSQSFQTTLAHLEKLKRRGKLIANGWASLRHFRSFPEDTKLPCAAGWVIATMDPEGVLFPCGETNRKNRSNSVVKLGASTAFGNLSRSGCRQCWCARMVEGNYAWGCRVDRMIPPLRVPF